MGPLSSIDRSTPESVPQSFTHVLLLHPLVSRQIQRHFNETPKARRFRVHLLDDKIFFTPMYLIATFSQCVFYSWSGDSDNVWTDGPAAWQGGGFAGSDLIIVYGSAFRCACLNGVPRMLRTVSD